MKASSIYKKILQEHSSKPSHTTEDKELLFSGIRTVVLSVEVLLNCSTWEVLTELFNFLLHQPALFTDFHMVGVVYELVVGWVTTRPGLNAGKTFCLWLRRWRVMILLKLLLFIRQSTNWLCCGIKRSRFTLFNPTFNHFQSFHHISLSLLFFNYTIIHHTSFHI